MFYRRYILLLLILCSPVSHAAISVGDEITGFLGRTLDGVKINAEDFRGKVTIISFWATWCPPCMKELPVLAKIQEKIGSNKIQIIGINFKQSKKVIKALESIFPDSDMILTYDFKGKVSKRYRVKAIPFMLIVGSDGIVVANHIGYSEKIIPQLVNEINISISESLKSEQTK